MGRLALPRNPTYEDVIYYYRNITMRQAVNLFIGTRLTPYEKNSARYCSNKLAELKIISYKKKDKHRSTHVEDFIYHYDHNSIIDKIYTLPEFEETIVDFINFYSDFILFLKQYLIDLLEEFNFKPRTSLF